MSRERRSLVTATAVAIAGILGVSPALAETKTYCANAARTPIGEAKRLASGAYVVEIPKCVSQTGQPVKQLAVTYEWRTDTRRSAEVAETEKSFQITFADTPRSYETGKITLTFSFGMTDTEKKEAQNSLGKLVELLVAWTSELAAGGRTALQTRLNTDLARKAPSFLGKLRDRSGSIDGLALALATMGIEKKNGVWEVPADLFVRLDAVSKATDWSDSDAKRFIAGAQSKRPSSDCEKASKAFETATSSSEIDRRIKRPTLALSACLGEAIKDASFSTLPEKWQGAAKRVWEAARSGALEQDNSVVAELVTLQSISSSFPTSARPFWDPIVAFVQLIRAQRKALNNDVANFLNEVAFVVEEAVVSDAEHALFEGARSKRFYDFSTGVVYVNRLDDFAVPLFVSICPFECMNGDIYPWDRRGFWKNFHRTLALDIGVNTAFIDGPDRRVKPSVQFMVGVSWNPLSLIRFASGAFFFQNQLDDEQWQVSGYVGVTADLVRAAELFGVAGFGSPQPPTWMPKE